MKNYFLVSLLFVLALSSCKKDLVDAKFSSQLSETSDEIVVNSGTFKGVSGNYVTEFDLDLSNPDTQDYLDRLKEIELSDVKLQFQGLSALNQDDTATDLIITIDNAVVFNFNHFKYMDVASGQDFILDDTQKTKQIADYLLSNKKVHVKIQGTIPSANQFNFYIKFLAKAEITAKAL